jgi:hypothetical protein
VESIHTHPRPLHGTLGTKLKRSLHTGSLREAQARRWPVVAELKALVAGKAQGQSTDSAEAWRAALAAGDGGPYDPTPHLLHDHLDALRGDPIVTEEDVDGSPVYIYHPERERRAVEFADRAYDRATPVDTYVDTYLAAERTKDIHRRALGLLREWTQKTSTPFTIQSHDPQGGHPVRGAQGSYPPLPDAPGGQAQSLLAMVDP